MSRFLFVMEVIGEKRNSNEIAAQNYEIRTYPIYDVYSPLNRYVTEVVVAVEVAEMCDGKTIEFFRQTREYELFPHQLGMVGFKKSRMAKRECTGGDQSTAYKKLSPG